MKFTLRTLSNQAYSMQMEDGKCIVTRHKFPQMKILYNPEKRMGSVLEKEANVSEVKIQQAFFKTLDWANKNKMK